MIGFFFSFMTSLHAIRRMYILLNLYFCFNCIYEVTWLKHLDVFYCIGGILLFRLGHWMIEYTDQVYKEQSSKKENVQPFQILQSIPNQKQFF